MDVMLLMKSQRNTSMRQYSIPDPQDYETLQDWHIRWY